jgi:hypothetical protein
MADEAKNNRSAQDLPGPETMQIAALLAELMPPGGLGSKAGPSPLSILADQLPGPTASEVREMSPSELIELAPPAQAVPPPLPEVKVPPTAASVVVTPTMTPNRPTRRITASVVAANTQPPAPPKVEPKIEKKVEPPPPPAPKPDLKTDKKAEPSVPRIEVRAQPPRPQPEPKVEAPPPKPQPEPKKAQAPAPKAQPVQAQPPKSQPEPKVEAQTDKPAPQPSAFASPVTVPLTEIIKLQNRKTDAVAGKPAATDAPKAKAAEPVVPLPTAVPADDLIPLGDLSVGGYFSLVNWRNDPEQTKHPRRSDYGLDEQTLALARQNPFYVIGKPRRPEARNVASVLSEIAWE